MQPFVLRAVLGLSTSLSLYPAYLFSLSSCPLLYYHPLSLCPLSSSLPLYTLNFSPPLYLSRPLYIFHLLSFPLCRLFASLSSYLQGNTSGLEMWCSDPCCGIQNRARISAILCPSPCKMCSELMLPPLPLPPLCLLNTLSLQSCVSLCGQKVESLLC